jgi:hypothetical protein
MSDYTDEEIGRAMREYWEFQGLGSAGDQISAIKELYARDAERRDLDRCTPYTTADLRAALAAEREAGAKTERINFDIWSDEYAPPADSPLLAGVFGAETVPEWLTTEERRYGQTVDPMSDELSAAVIRGLTIALKIRGLTIALKQLPQNAGFRS